MVFAQSKENIKTRNLSKTISPYSSLNRHQGRRLTSLDKVRMGTLSLLESLHDTQRRLFELLVSGCRKFRKYFPSHRLLGSLLGRSRRHIIRLLKDLSRLGLIVIRGRGHYHSNVYKINEYRFGSIFWNRGVYMRNHMKDRPARSSFSDVTLLKEYDNNIKDTVSTLETGSLKKHMPWYEQEDDNKEEEDYARSELIIHNAVQEDREESTDDALSILRELGLL